MKKEWKRRISKLLIAGMAVTTVCTGYGRKAPVMQAAEIASRGVSSGIFVTKHSKEEIRSYLREHPINLKQFGNPVTYAEEPVVSAPYSPGKISGDTQERALTTLNAIRYIAGISDDVTFDGEYEKKVQAGTLVNYVNDELSHRPAQPGDMDKDLYDLGYSGTSSSNLAWASWAVSLEYTLVHSWMADDDRSNIERVGHRRWVLNPAMGKTAFGAVAGSNGTYSGMYSFDRSKTASQYGVCWPAQTMPLDFFDDEYPWSISMGKSVDASKVFVTITRERDGQTWYFSSSLADGDFYVNNDYYGQTGCIIFRPNGAHYEDGDVFEVEIGGLSEPVSYEVEFFASAESTPSPTASQTPTLRPSVTPSKEPDASTSPTVEPTRTPEGSPSATPENTSEPTRTPEGSPSAAPENTSRPSSLPTQKPAAISGSGSSNISPSVGFVAGKPAKAVIRSLKNKKSRKIQVEMKRQQGVSGYQIQYGTKRNMESAKKITVKNNRATLKKLRAKQIYYVRARAYRMQNGKRLYGSWSSKRKIEVKR